MDNVLPSSLRKGQRPKNVHCRSSNSGEILANWYSSIGIHQDGVGYPNLKFHRVEHWRYLVERQKSTVLLATLLWNSQKYIPIAPMDPMHHRNWLLPCRLTCIVLFATRYGAFTSCSDVFNTRESKKQPSNPTSMRMQTEQSSVAIHRGASLRRGKHISHDSDGK